MSSVEPFSVEATLFNEKNATGGTASEALSPGMGVNVDPNADDPDRTVSTVDADSPSKFVALENQISPVGATDGTGVFEYEYSQGEHVEVTGFNENDQARVQIEDGVTADTGDVGWTASGTMAPVGSDGGPTSAVARVRTVYENVTGDVSVALVTFY